MEYATQTDNSHLDDRDRAILADRLTAWEGHTGRPRVGDFVIMPNNHKRRCSHEWDHGMQPSTGGSYYIGGSGNASMSGGLYPSQPWEYFQPTDEMEPGRFWFFSHNVSGAGRGVEVFLPCRVYRLVPFTMTEDEARNHPTAQSAAEFWGEGHRDHLAAIAKLMFPPVMQKDGYW